MKKLYAIILFASICTMANAQYTKLLDFNDTNGQSPSSSLMQASDGMLYGMTKFGGANGAGVLFQYNPATSV